MTDMVTTMKSGEGVVMQSVSKAEHSAVGFAKADLTRFATDVSEQEWSAPRKFLAKVIGRKSFELMLGIMVLTSLALGIIRTDKTAGGESIPVWIAPAETCLLLLYVLEMLSRLYVFRLSLFRLPLNVLDFSIVAIDVLVFILTTGDVDLPQVSFLRVCRLFKLCQVFHILASQPQLFVMMESLVSSMVTLVCGCFFIAIALVIFSILAVELLHPLSEDVEFSSTCSRCQYGFSSVYMAMCSLIQTAIVGDDWGTLFLPYLERYPLTQVFIFPVFVSINFGFMNLIMAVIVDCASQSRVSNLRLQAQEKQNDFQRNKNRLYNICKEMDTDHSNSINLEELLDGFKNNPAFKRTCQAMDIREDELTAVFNILDEDNSGDVEYGEFTNQLHKMKSNDSHTMLVFIKHYVMDLRKKVQEEMVMMKDQIAGGISQLHRTVGEELELIKADMALHVNALELSDQRIAAEIKKESQILTEEQKLVKEDVNLHHQIMGEVLTSNVTSSVKTRSAGMSATQSQDLAVDGQLRVATEQIVAMLENLRRQCENSAATLNTFNGLLPRNNGEVQSSLRGASQGFEVGRSSWDAGQPITLQGMQAQTRGLWQPKGCCVGPEYAPGQPGIRPR